MNRFLIFFSLVGSILATHLAIQAYRAMPRQIFTGNHYLRMQIEGKGSPTSVFETFGPANLEAWNRVQPKVARFATTVTYDHAGYWGSEPGAKPRDARQIARELHSALRSANVPPPYLMVGYSFGGPYVRVFAGMYPEEVCGMLLIDPTQEEFMDMLRTKYPKLNVVSEKHRAAQNEWGCQYDSLEQARNSLLPNIPITLITGMAKQDILRNKFLPRWLESHRNWINQVPNGKHLITTNSGHDVIFKEPQLVTEAVRELIGKTEPSF